MKTILAVWNRAGRGKTQSIQEFAKALLHTYPSHIILHAKPSIIPSKSGGDFRLVVEINKHIIGIESQGDPNTNLEFRLNELVTAFNCDIIICSTRTSGGTVYAVDNISKKYSFQVVWSSTYEMIGKANQTHINKLKGKHMLELLNSLGVI